MGELVNTVKQPPRRELISIVFSFFNEAENIPELIARIRAVFSDLPDYDYEMVFVNDCSTDNSFELLNEARRQRDDVVILNTTRQFGHMPGLFAGLEEARGDAVIYMDADIQDPPELIPKMLNAWKSEPDVGLVYTTRTHRDGESTFKLIVTKIGYQILASLSEIPIYKDSGDYRLLSRRALNEVLKFKEKRPFFRFLSNWVGFKHKQVMYRREPRFQGKSKFSIFSRKVYFQFLEISLFPFSDAPLRMSLMLGIATSCFAFFYLMRVLYMKSIDANLPGWTAIMCTLLLMSGIQFIVSGIQGLYIGAIHSEIRGRPNYIIRDKIGREDNVPEV